jgi:hypothetical protein
MLILGLIFGTIVLFGIGMAGFYWFYLATRQKKVTYVARIWETSGELNPLRNKEGIVIDPIKLKVMKPYDMDVIEKVDLEYKNTIYRLIKHNRPVPEVKAEHITHWGKDKRVVDVLKDGDNFTLLRKGCRTIESTNESEEVFQPIDYDLSNMLLNQFAIKMDRRKKEKDALVAITPWIVVGICMVGMVISSYLLAQGWVRSSESQELSAEMNSEASKHISNNLVEVARVVKSQTSQGSTSPPSTPDHKLGLQESAPNINSS